MVLVFYTDDAIGQTTVVMGITWIYALYFAIFRPFVMDNAVVIISRIFILGGLAMDHSWPHLIIYACIYFALVHIWRLSTVLYRWSTSNCSLCKKGANGEAQLMIAHQRSNDSPRTTVQMRAEIVAQTSTTSAQIQRSNSGARVLRWSLGHAAISTKENGTVR